MFWLSLIKAFPDFTFANVSFCSCGICKRGTIRPLTKMTRLLKVGRFHVAFFSPSPFHDIFISWCGCNGSLYIWPSTLLWWHGILDGFLIMFFHSSFILIITQLLFLWLTYRLHGGESMVKNTLLPSAIVLQCRTGLTPGTSRYMEHYDVLMSIYCP